MFKCYNRVPGASPNTENVRKKQQPSTFLFLVKIKPFSCKLVKKTSRLDFAPPVPLKGDVIIILSPLNLHVSTHGTAIVFSLATTVYISSNATAKVRAKHTYCSVFGCTDEYRTLFRVPASEETREQWIYWFIYCILSCCHTDLI